MNTRIQELAEQQGFTGPNFYISSDELQKFAELLIQESAFVARKHLLTMAGRSYMTHKIIKSHFGLEHDINEVN